MSSARDYRATFGEHVRQRSSWSSPVSPSMVWSPAHQEPSPNETSDSSYYSVFAAQQCGPGGAPVYSMADPSSSHPDSSYARVVDAPHSFYTPPVSRPQDYLFTRRSTPDLRYHAETYPSGPPDPATFSRPAHLPDAAPSRGPCADIGQRGLMMFGLDAADQAPLNPSSSWTRASSRFARSERLVRPKSYPSLDSAPHRSTEWPQHPVEPDYYRQDLSGTSYGPPRAGGGPPTPRESPLPPLLSLPDISTELDPSEWVHDELPQPPPLAPYYDDVATQPVHPRAIAYDYASVPARAPRTRQMLPRLLTGMTLAQEAVPSVLEHPPLSCAPSDNVMPVFTLPASGYASSSSCSSQFRPESHMTSTEWFGRHLVHDPAIDTPLPVSAPVDGGRFQPYPSHRRSRSQASSILEGMQPESSLGEQHYSCSPAMPKLPLATPPTSPSRTRPNSVSSSASELGLQMSPIHPRHRKSPRTPFSTSADEAAGAKKKPHKCAHPDCDRAFKRAEHLRRHERVHTQERPFQCHEHGCGMRFSRHDNLLQHQKTHFKNGKTRRAVAARLAQAEAARAAAFGFTHTFVAGYSPALS
ncbi:hypothetical protein C6P46_004961 [Rhodotorula mucilaginosa]|uniref:C2H2-type domain-containing protein n=1 Tax=Rhodotorula mucilaginosa TaxID=5537 RepID=A0A9P6W9G8_RHOMI|nr:hypothetical protein C6P46_004961 [Rhodotorula mucilaginosa]